VFAFTTRFLVLRYIHWWSLPNLFFRGLWMGVIRNRSVLYFHAQKRFDIKRRWSTFLFFSVILCHPTCGHFYGLARLLPIACPWLGASRVVSICGGATCAQTSGKFLQEFFLTIGFIVSNTCIHDTGLRTTLMLSSNVRISTDQRIFTRFIISRVR